jgi:hypothetical protein
VTTFIAVIAVALLFAGGLAIDGGRKLGALSEARDLADNAARVGAQQIDVAAWRETGVPYLDPGAAAAEASAYLATTGNTGRATVDGDTITVTVTLSVPTRILPGPLTVSATESASARASVTGAP